MPRGRHRHSPPLHRLLPPSAVAGASVLSAAGAWLLTDPVLLRSLAAVAAAAAVGGAVLMRSWDRAAGRRVAEITRGRASDAWQHEERVAELESEAEEAREQRAKLETKLRAKRVELAKLRNEHAELLRRYAAAETGRASALEGRRRLAVEAGADQEADEVRELPAAGASPTAATYLRAAKALDALARNAEAQQRRTAGEPVRPGGRPEPAPALVRAAGPAAKNATTAPGATAPDAPAADRGPAVNPARGGAPANAAAPAPAANSTSAGDSGDLANPASAAHTGNAAAPANAAAPKNAALPGATPNPAGPAPAAADPTVGPAPATPATPEPGADPAGGGPAAAADGAPAAHPVQEGTAVPGTVPAPRPDGTPDGDGGGSRTAAKPGAPAAPRTTPASRTAPAPAPAAAPALPAGPAALAALPAAPSGPGAIVPYGPRRTAGTPVRRPEGGFDFFGTQHPGAPAAGQRPAGDTTAPAVADPDGVGDADLADVVGDEAIAEHRQHTGRTQPAPVSEVIDLTAHDETEKLDMTGLRNALSS
ncbi:hypothetical protein ACWDR0_32195 [Streptomyces sp. NPDC003691]